MDKLSEDMRRQLLHLGIVSYREQESMFALAKRCAKTSGLPLGVAIGAVGAKAGTVTLPGVGTMSGAAAGFLAGLTTGTASCMALNIAARDELKALASGK